MREESTMKDQVIMTKSGELAVAIPLYRVAHDEGPAYPGHYFCLVTGRPLAYVIDIGQNGFCDLLSARWVEENFEFLGELK